MTAAFLKINGIEIEFQDGEAFSFLSNLYETGTMKFSELDRWLRAHVRYTPQQ